MQTAVRKRAADFDFWGNTPTPEFCENSHERGPRSPAGTAQGFVPPLGATPERGGRGAAAVPESSGRRRTGGGVLRRARRGRRFAGAARARRCVGQRGGRFRGARSRSLPSGRRREAGRGRAWPREAHKGRVAGAAARGGHVAGRRGAGGLRGFPGRTRGRRGGLGAARPGRLPIAGARRAAARQNGCTQRGLCRVSGHLCDRGGRRAKKPVFAL